MTVLTAIALLMSALSASAQNCSFYGGYVSCVNLKGDISKFIDLLDKMGENELFGVKDV